MTFGSAGRSPCLPLLASDCDQLPARSFLSRLAQMSDSLTLCRPPPKYPCYTLQVTDGGELELHAAKQNTGCLGCRGRAGKARRWPETNGSRAWPPGQWSRGSTRGWDAEIFQLSHGRLLTYSTGSIHFGAHRSPLPFRKQPWMMTTFPNYRLLTIHSLLCASATQFTWITRSLFYMIVRGW